MKLIINADDFGLSRAVNYGIIEAHKQGVVTSTTALVTAEAFQECKDLALRYPSLSVGIHLNVTLGKALISDSDLVDKEGNFFSKMEYIDGFKKNTKDLYAEWKKQIETFISIMGAKPTHIDSHHHIHMLKEVQPVVRTLADEYGLMFRGGEGVTLNTDFYGNQVQESFFHDLPMCDVLELMVHPAFVDTSLLKATSYALERLKEYDILTLPSIRKKIEQSGYTLCNYKEVTNAKST